MSVALCLLLAPLVVFGTAIPADFTRLLSTNSGDLATSDIVVPAPAKFTSPSDQNQVIATVGRGVQNYTCSGGSWVSIGAVASLYDIAPVVDFTHLPIQTISSMLPKMALKLLPFPTRVGPRVDIHHYFVNMPNTTAASPKFESATSSVILKKLDSVDAPNKATDVAWLQLEALPGQNGLASYVYRLYTSGGQPPSKCTVEGSLISVQYASMYFFTKP
ncbi:hypothetical protein BD324DRAFT_628870 [Kockovaella imperatae]|uniref:Malate dehydrogenase n=1 Tax=Kockovaella imperatae TaxID=4999 RepID=A0A1Y1UG09_9TREE|nr:hypothetical protein BD324DRAFT_628870 [Kockovaella imperatae]ORX36444.1 hypothetical protein BD324DRAFT_628870 [Kockovaella imperatae]